jgi:hypothetical protein
MRVYIATLATAFAFAAIAGEGERNIPLDQLTPEIKAAADQAMPGVKWLRAEQETEKGGVRYELKGTSPDNGRPVEVEISPDGKLIQTEVELPFKDAPEGIRNKLETGWPGFEPKETKAVTRAGGPKGYEFEGPSGKGRELEVFISEDGSIVEVEEEAD